MSPIHDAQPICPSSEMVIEGIRNFPKGSSAACIFGLTHQKYSAEGLLKDKKVRRFTNFIGLNINENIPSESPNLFSMLRIAAKSVTMHGRTFLQNFLS